MNLQVEEINQVDIITETLVKHNVTEAVISKLQDYKTLTISGVEDKEGFKMVHSARMEAKNTRILAEKICDKEKEGAALIVKAWNKKKSEIVSQIKEVEEVLQAEEDRIEAEKEKIREEERRAKAAILQGRVDKLAEYGFAHDHYELEIMDDEEFNSLLDHAKEEFGKVQAAREEEERLRKEETERLAREKAEYEAAQKKLEEERAQFEREKAEQERIRSEAAEAARKKQEEEERKLREEMEKIEAEKRKIEEEKRIESAKKEAAEKAIREAEEAKAREEKEKAEREAREKEEAERRERLRPDKEKLLKFAEEIASIKVPETKSREAAEILVGYSAFIQKATDYITEKAKGL